MKKKYTKKYGAPSHVGEILKSGFLDQYEISIITFSNLIGITREHLSRIINGHSPVTPDIASKLEILTKTPASQWLSIQAKYDAYVLEQNTDFQKYKKTIESWIKDSLPLLPSKRRVDKESMMLVAKAGELAKRISRKNKMA